MDAIARESWKPDAFCISVAKELPDHDLAVAVYDRACRTDFSAPGFCLLSLGPEFTSVAFRRFVVSLKEALQRLHQSRQDRDLVFVSAARFDQQVTTKLHRDGGPDESLLILGYEPSSVLATIHMADYSRCAFEMGLTPREFLDKHNPMFGPGEQLLRPYTTRVACFVPGNYQIVVINNSIAPFDSVGGAWQGVLHTATIDRPSDELSRVVNSTMVASLPIGSPEPVSRAEQEAFVNSTIVHKRGYDRPQLVDG
jgi:hypothetical protein